MTFTPQPSLDWEGIDAALAKWAGEMTGLEVAWAGEDGPQPDHPFVTLDWLVNPSGVGEDYYHDEVNADDKLERELNGVRRGVLTVKVESASTRGGSNAVYYLDLLLGSLNDSEVTAKYFNEVNMAVWDFAELNPGDFVREKRAVSRAGVDITLGFGAGNGTPSKVGDYIKGVAITGTVNQPPEYEQTLEVNDEEA